MNKVIIIAQAGVNHNGDIQLAKKLIDAAVEAGVDYVRFQPFKADNLVSKTALFRSRSQNTHGRKSYFSAALKCAHLSRSRVHLELRTICIPHASEAPPQNSR